MQEQSNIGSCSRHVFGNEKSLREWKVEQEERVRDERESEKSSLGTGMGDGVDIQKLAVKEESCTHISEVNFLNNFAEIFTKGFDQSCFPNVVELNGMFNPE